MTPVRFLVMLCVLSLAAAASAQTGALVTGQAQVYAPGVALTGTVTTANPNFTSQSFPISSAMCNLTPIAQDASVVVAPTRLQFADPINAGKACIFDLTQFLAGLPPLAPNTCSQATPAGCYTATAIVTDDFGLTSDRSAVSNPFSPRARPAAPTLLRLVK